MSPPPDRLDPSRLTLTDLAGPLRERAVPLIRDGFVGLYRWHAKRTLREVPIVRGAEIAGELVGVTLLDLLVPEVGYVYYVVVLRTHRQRGLGGLLVDDALSLFRDQGVEVVYAAVRSDNPASWRVCERRGFRVVERKETGWREGGLGAWGLRSRMRLVPGEKLLGLRLKEPHPGGAASTVGRPRRGDRRG